MNIYRNSSIMVVRVAVLLLINVSRIVAQEVTPEPMEETIPQVLRIGASVGVAAGINTADIPIGWQTGLSIPTLPALGITGMITVVHSIGIDAMLDMGITSTAFQSRPFFQRSDSNMITMQATYLSIAPSLVYRYGFLGMGIGIPIAASTSTFDGTRTTTSIRIPDSAPLQAGNTIVPLRSLLSMMIDLRIGGQLPIITDERGTLMLFGVASYQVNSMFSDVRSVQQITYQGSVVSESAIPRSATLTIGLRYLFNLSLASQEEAAPPTP